MKQKGILLPIFSLPSKHGIGDLGNEAYEFVDILSENKIDYWEILPITATEKLPYSPQSYYALNIDYISLEKIKEMGLLSNIDNIEEEKLSKEEKINSYKQFKEKYYKIAYNNFNQKEKFTKYKEEYNNYKKENKKIIEYAKYIEKNTGEKEAYSIFLQFILDKQWNELKKYANIKNVKIIGDMPIYPNYNSAEVQNNLSCFELKNGKMEYVSGVPADKYNKDGQVWGTPVYNYNYLKENNYTYLLERYEEFLKRFDIIRIDHFIGYDTYYKIPINQDSSKGQYEQGPSYSFFDELLKITLPEKFIVEDLGAIKQSTIKLRENYGFTGSEIMQQWLDLDENKRSEVFEKENIVLYSGTHDCNTIIGWYKALSVDDKKKLKRILKSKKCNNLKINKAVIKYCMKSKSKIVILPVQDVLGLDSCSRINIPGKNLEENWCWRLDDFCEIRRKIRFYGKIK